MMQKINKIKNDDMILKDAMKVFISWSGPFSKYVALVLRKYLPCMMQRLDIFMSQHDIESGARWNMRLVEELDSSSFGILCLTPENVNSAWLLYEAGALTKHMEGQVCGLLLGGLSPTDVTGPLAQFQHRSFVKSELFALLNDLNQRAEHPLSEGDLSTVFTKWWPDLEAAYNEAMLRKKEDAKTIFVRDQRDILEEILASVRGFERQLALTPPSGFCTSPAVREKQYAIWDTLTEPQKRLIAYLVKQDEPGHQYVKNPEPDDYKELPILEQMGVIMKTGRGYVLDADVARLFWEKITIDYSIP
jgi:hypothetical protein